MTCTVFPSDLEGLFGKGPYEIIQRELFFNDTKALYTQELLLMIYKQHRDVMKSLDTIAMARNEYSQLCMSKMSGSRDKYGSKNSENN